jgi:PPM family protein phosphatase
MTQSARAKFHVGGAILDLVWSSQTHVGNLRKLNEDSLLASAPVFVVADGMGGHQGGEVASALAVGALASLSDRHDVMRSEVEATVQTANRLINQRSTGGERGMGTTITGLVATRTAFPPTMTILNVGDSRTYRLRDRALTQLTTDHSHVQELVARGLLAPEDAAHHPERNVVTRALGVDADVDVDTIEIDVIAGDRFLVCSDGLTGELSLETMQRVLLESTADVAAARLVGKTLAGPARDNVSVIVVDIVGVEPSDSEEVTAPRRIEPPTPTNDITSPNRRAAKKSALAHETEQLIDVVPVAPVPVVEPADILVNGKGRSSLIEEVPFVVVEKAAEHVSQVDERSSWDIVTPDDPGDVGNVPTSWPAPSPDDVPVDVPVDTVSREVRPDERDQT